MASSIDLGEDDGFIDVTIGGATVQLDLWITNARMADYHKANAGKSEEEYHRGLVGVLQDVGLPTVSGAMAYRFVKAVGDAVREKKDAASPPAGSPASTTSTPTP